MNKKNVLIYTGIAFAWSYSLWLTAIGIALNSQMKIYLNEGFVEALYSNVLTGKVAIISVIALLASLGPLVGAGVVSLIDPVFKEEFKQRLFIYKSSKPYLHVIGIFLAIGFIPAIPLIFIEGFTSTPISTILLYLITFFLIQLVTSGTEEFGWRGLMLPEFLKENDVWTASFKTGLVWAVWHTPIVMYIFYLQGMPMFAMLFSFVGFSVGIVAMSVVHSYFFIKTKSVLFSVFLHATSNTIPLIAGMLILDSYKTAVFAQLLIWGVIFMIMKRNPEMFPKTKKS
ncbi:MULTISPECIES: CPBP family intramembrane glutamic endopeptidase [unclassified Fusibacter]|uniref:CPBP family intramembrane glutamic endopeptidase n=1 Tax=unclassified Fusibacter TaxID=2624464 RepID=UPI00101024E4|nr:MULTISPECIES: type II CAAX endopeptidase family protein [unclassified Fusibacter]MCK8058147.1 CPBP family intramembrane metalloprotease [Fusibacter sp. A2]NPE20729.1 CPBP family intramembrane metalloprotease [Fusibacter sp. A1]RXV62935.1 CPBP family intramembrane metalloprotease [Fusibacter sp. A1]